MRSLADAAERMHALLEKRLRPSLRAERAGVLCIIRIPVRANMGAMYSEGSLGHHGGRGAIALFIHLLIHEAAHSRG